MIALIVTIPTLPLPPALLAVGFIGCMFGAVVCMVRLKKGKP